MIKRLIVLIDRKVRKMKRREGQTWQDAQSAQTPAPQHIHLHDSCWVSASLPLCPFLKHTLHSKHGQPLVFIAGIKQLAFKQTQLLLSEVSEATCSHTHSLPLSYFPFLAFHPVPPAVMSSNWPHPTAQPCLHTHLQTPDRQLPGETFSV